MNILLADSSSSSSWKWSLYRERPRSSTDSFVPTVFTESMHCKSVSSSKQLFYFRKLLTSKLESHPLVVKFLHILPAASLLILGRMIFLANASSFLKLIVPLFREIIAITTSESALNGYNLF